SQRTEIHFAKALFFASLVGALLFFLLGELLFSYSGLNTIVLVGIYFAVFGLLLALALFAGARICRLDFSAKTFLVSGICILLLFVLGMLFEFIYELNFAPAKTVTASYVFAIDNSGSMAQNDPDGERIAAMEEALEGEDETVEYAVYTFASEVRCVRKMAPIGDGMGELDIEPGGSTEIVGVLSQIADDMKDGTLPCDEGTQVILLTDGYATDSDLLGLKINRILKQFNNRKVSVSTVGLGAVDENFLNNISDKTGGLSVTTDNVDELGNAMVSVVRKTDATRTLLSARSQVNMNWLYGILRVLFVAILGMIFIGIKIAMTDDTTDTRMLVIVSAVGSLLGACILEFGLALVLTGFVARLFMVVLFALTITTVEAVKKMGFSYGSLGMLH
ncbi:MAG: VWA domain-containing protein, partial [Clostridiales bacterium]|nr:VWA domain-containing protein [Clostridiales bacterium]